MTKRIFFDDSLRLLVETANKLFGADGSVQSIILRDSIGRLKFVTPHLAPPEENRIEMEKQFRDVLGNYARSDDVLMFGNDPGAKRLLDNREALVMTVGEQTWRVIDRRIVGSGWLAEHPAGISGPPRVVFASLKGGVGRSTALAVAAADFAARDQNVLVIDLDLEAPGLGELLLDADRMPRFGVVDYLVETPIDPLSEADLADFIGTSTLTLGTGGVVDVVPAFGKRSAEAPENILGKLARSMIEDVTPDGNLRPLGMKISDMIDRLVRTPDKEYDVVLIDSRAGLSELAAPAVLGLGGLILLFGTAQQQTVSGYQALFAGLKLLVQRDLFQRDSGRDSGCDSVADWRLMLKPVYAKASLDPEIANRHFSDLYDLFAENLYDEDNGPEYETPGKINFAIDDPDAPHRPLIIPFDPRFVDFDPRRDPSQIDKPFYEQTFRPFLGKLEQMIQDYTEDPAQDLGEIGQ